MLCSVQSNWYYGTKFGADVDQVAVAKRKYYS